MAADAARSEALGWLPPAQANPWQHLSSTTCYQNAWMTVREDAVVAPDGNRSVYGVVSPTNVALGVVPIDQQGYTWLVGQYRYPLDCYSWEIPEGGGNPELDNASEAARELREETGLVAATMEHLMTLHTSNCFTSEQAHIFVARDLTMGQAQPDPSEKLQVCRLPLQSAIELARCGVITDGMSVAALLRLAADEKSSASGLHGTGR